MANRVFELYSMVRVVRLLGRPEDYDGWIVNRRPPKIGDMGAFIDILQAPGLPKKYVVENSGVDGVTIWLTDFFEDELEPATNAATE